MGFNLRSVLHALSKVRPLFHSEADFQHSLAWEIHKMHPTAIVRLEIPSGRLDKRERIDIWMKLDKNVYVIELKYKKTEFRITHNGEQYNLRADSAQDISRYDYLKDLTRLETYVSTNKEAVGFALMLTNDDLYWKESSNGVNSADFFLHEGRVLKNGRTMDWHINTADGTKNGRSAPHILGADYTINWEDYSTIEQLSRKNKFRFLLLEIKSFSKTN